ncbi:helix-turn-helix domain-containing protein [Massilia sp. METH4]|uniref:helix-turn-helix domain-containing protein n=1 Tax=Massilia sp. METH4 TaxID=3123041 RepID=UPI0030D3F343
MLAAQREAMGLSVEQIADQLKLAPRQVVAIEQGDYASLPNMAVTRGFIRAYAKVVRLDPAPLVAQIEVTPAVTATDHHPVRREKITTTFSESRFPTLTERHSKPKMWIIGGVVALAVVGVAAAWQAGLLSPAALTKPGTATPAVVGTPAAPGTAATTAPAPATAATTPPLLSPNVPLVSTPGPATPENTAPLVTTPAPNTAAASGAAATAPAATPPAAVTPPAGTPATAAAVPAPAATPAAPAAQGANTLTMVFTADSWVEIRRPGASPLISRLVKAGSTESFEIDRQSTLIVGAPDGVRATLRGQPLPLPKVANGTISRVQIK